MNGDHLTETELLELADGGGSDAARAHVAACPECSRAASEAAQGRRLLQAAAPLGPSPSLDEAIAALPARSRSRRRLLWVGLSLVPAAAAIAAAAVVLTGGGGRHRPSIESATPFRRNGLAPQAPGLSRTVAGPAAAVAALLRKAGLRATVAGPTLVVAHGDPGLVSRALAARPAGPVRVELRR